MRQGKTVYSNAVRLTRELSSISKGNSLPCLDNDFMSSRQALFRGSGRCMCVCVPVNIDCCSNTRNLQSRFQLPLAIHSHVPQASMGRSLDIKLYTIPVLPHPAPRGSSPRHAVLTCLTLRHVLLDVPSVLPKASADPAPLLDLLVTRLSWSSS